MGNAKWIVSAVLIGLVSAQAQVKKIACIGNSITAGTGNYPGKLATLLGAGYTVENDGEPGTTLLKKGDGPYWVHGHLAKVLALKPSIITIKLGTNDSKPQNWKLKSQFEPDLIAMIDTLEKFISPKPVIWLCLPLPAWPINGNNAFAIDGQIIANEVIPIIKKVAADRKLNVIDLHTALMGMKSHFPDGVHPDGVGQDSIAANIYRALTKVASPVLAAQTPVFPELNLRGRDLRLSMPGGLPARMQITDMMGRSLKSWNVPAGAASVYPLAGFAPGIYGVAIDSEAGHAAKRLELH